MNKFMRKGHKKQLQKKSLNHKKRNKRVMTKRKNSSNKLLVKKGRKRISMKNTMMILPNLQHKNKLKRNLRKESRVMMLNQKENKI